MYLAVTRNSRKLIKNYINYIQSLLPIRTLLIYENSVRIERSVRIRHSVRIGITCEKNYLTHY